jgi:hypothetical protein
MTPAELYADLMRDPTRYVNGTIYDRFVVLRGVYGGPADDANPRGPHVIMRAPGFRLSCQITNRAAFHEAAPEPGDTITVIGRVVQWNRSEDPRPQELKFIGFHFPE